MKADSCDTSQAQQPRVPVVEFYGQNEEDRVAYHYLSRFPETELNKTYLDIGAYDGVHLSNTRLFEELGWSGICVEADAIAFEDLRRNRSCICLHLACSDHEGEVVLVSQPGRPMGTTQAEAVERLRRGWKFRRFERQTVPAKTVDQILTDHDFRKVDFVSLDVDGGEVDVLRGFDLRRADVKLLCVETNLNAVQAGKWPETHVREIDRIVRAQGYRLLKHHGANSFYVRDRWPWLTRMILALKRKGLRVSRSRISVIP